MTAREGDAAELIITVPALLDPDALSDEQLDVVAGGDVGYLVFESVR